jgi:hypothetical protein
MAPEAVPEASGRTLIAPAEAFDMAKALPNMMIICVPNSQDGVWFSPVKPQMALSSAPASWIERPSQIMRSRP